MNSRLAESTSRPSRTRGILLCILLILPLLAGAAIAGVTGWDPARSWSSEGTGAPSAANADSAALSDAARTASEAQAQAGFLKSGTGQLATGTGKLKEGADGLGGGVDKLSSGSQELYDGLVQLQSGTAQLGNGATEVANGVGAAVDQIVGLKVVQGQLLQAIDGTVKDLEGNNSAEARNIKSQLADLRVQVNNFQLDQNLTDQLTRLKEGSREISNQLAVNGYGYHDGVYKAVEGAKQLNDGTKQLDAKVDEALSGVKQLDDGAKKVDGMAKQNQSKVQEVQRALPAPTGGVQDARLLSPVVAMLIAVVLTLGGACLGAFVVCSGRSPWLPLFGGVVVLAVLAEIMFFLLATGPTGEAALWVGLAAVVTSLASAGLTTALLRYFGKVGAGLAVVLGLAQIAAVGWFWKSAVAAAVVGGAWKVVMGLLPLHWTTSALTVAGNGGDHMLLWTALGVLGVVSAFSLGVMKRPTESSEI